MAAKLDRTYLLIDAAPGMENRVFEQLDDIPAVTSKRLVRHGNVDLVAVLESRSHDRAEATIGGSIRFLEGVKNVTEVHESDLEDLPLAVREAITTIR